MDPFPRWMERLWDSWDVRIMILWSLILQVTLIIFGSRRKYVKGIWIDFIVWPAYLMADWVAAISLSKLSDVAAREDSIGNGSSAYAALMALWAPLLLLHLGGPDTITAYSVEDVKLWLRHLLGLGVHLSLSVYVVLRCWTGFNWLLLTTFIAGFFKYSERTWALLSANNAFPQPYLPIPFNYEPREQVLRGSGDITPEEDTLARSYIWLQDLGAPVFAGLHDYQKGHIGVHLTSEMYEEDSGETNFKFVEMALALIYDALYTKATRIYTLSGCIFRAIYTICILTTLVGFSFTYEDHEHTKEEVFITFMLLAVAVVLEIYAFALIIDSDWLILWMIKHHKFQPLRRVLQVLASLNLNNTKRWSNSVPQLNFVTLLHSQEKPMLVCRSLKLFRLNEKLKEYQCRRYVDNLEHLKELIMKGIRKTVVKLDNTTSFTQRGKLALKRLGLKDNRLLEESVERDFDESIIIWHLITDYCCSRDNNSGDPKTESLRESCNVMSDYMMYLLVNHPHMLDNLSSGKLKSLSEDWTQISRKEGSASGDKGRTSVALATLIDVRRFVDVLSEEEKKKLAEYGPEHLDFQLTNIMKHEYRLRTLRAGFGDWMGDSAELIESLRYELAEIQVHSTISGDKHETLVGGLAENLAIMMHEKDDKWEILSQVWVEMLMYGAAHCQVQHHLNQLRRGGEFLTHIWLLLTIYGLTNTNSIVGGNLRSVSREAIRTRLHNIDPDI